MHIDKQGEHKRIKMKIRETGSRRRFRRCVDRCLGPRLVCVCVCVWLLLYPTIKRNGMRCEGGRSRRRDACREILAANQLTRDKSKVLRLKSYGDRPRVTLINPALIGPPNEIQSMHHGSHLGPRNGPRSPFTLDTRQICHHSNALTVDAPRRTFTRVNEISINNTQALNNPTKSI